jgi:Tfp pilus assembly protein PilF
MPKNPVIDVAHAAYTDHSIPRRAVAPARASGASKAALSPFGGGSASDRDLGLAYAALIETERNPAHEARAFELLKASIERQPNDVAALVQLAQLYGYRSEESRAIALYERALRLDPGKVVASNNLATYWIKQGRADDAMRLWSDAVSRSPGFEEARLNLAVAQFRTGDSASAERTLQKGLELNPGATEMRRMLNQLRRKN